MLVEEVQEGKVLTQPSIRYERNSRERAEHLSYILRLAIEADQCAFARV